MDLSKLNSKELSLFRQSIENCGDEEIQIALAMGLPSQQDESPILNAIGHDQKIRAEERVFGKVLK